MPSTGKRLNASWLWGFVLTTLVARRAVLLRATTCRLGEAADVYVRDPKVGAVASREEY